MAAGALLFLAVTAWLVVKFEWGVLVRWLVPWAVIALLAGALGLVFDRPRRKDPPNDPLDWF